MSDSVNANEKRAEAEAAVPKPLQPTFSRLVDDYEVSAKIHEGEVRVNYNILADLVRAGWRRVS
jgi:hypothetical protein